METRILGVLVLGLWLGSLANIRGDWIDTFDGAAFNVRWGEDEPDPRFGDVSLDTVNHTAHFTAASVINMWTLRDNAPILWTTAPAGNFTFETHVSMSTSQNYAQAGIVVYGSDASIPNFIFCLDHWASKLVKFQGVGDNIPNVFVAATGGEAWLRLTLLRGRGANGVDRYIAEYKLNAGDPWATLHTYDIDTANARVGLAFKTYGDSRSADFSYAKMTEPPATFIDTFDGTEFAFQWCLDEPNQALGNVTLDTNNDYAHFASPGNTDMWNVRNNAPILWASSPAGDFYIETHVVLPYAQSSCTAGLVVYGAEGTRPEFILQLNQWSTHLVHIQGLGDNNPNVSVSTTSGEVWLRLNLLRDAGVGGVDRYVAQYKFNPGDAWKILAVYDQDVPNTRAGLVFKADGGSKTADFSYAAIGALDIGVGDAIKLDYSTPGDAAGGSLADWNQIANAGGDIPVGRVIRHGDGAIVGGASITLSNYQVNHVDNNAHCNNWPGTAADPYYILAADDIYWHGNAAYFSTTFNVDPQFSYDVRIYALISDNPAYIERFVVTGEYERTVQNTRGDRWGAASLEDARMVFNSTIPNASGQIIVTVEHVTNTAYPLNAIVLEAKAVPHGTMFMLQ